MAMRTPGCVLPALHARDLRDIAQAQRPAAGLAFAAHGDGVALALRLQGEDRGTVRRRNLTARLAPLFEVEQLEGGAFMAETVRFLVERGVPVCAHIGLTPQAVHQLGGYRVQGRSDEGAATLKADALALEQAGASLMVMEMVPAALAAEVSATLTTMATIGIGAGVDCHGQVLVLHDLIGVFPGKRPRFAKNFMEGAASIDEAVTRYVTDVRESRFPGPEHSY